jgi:DNA-binding MarR family transcriptional regulator
MLVIWEYGSANMKLLGEKLRLDSGTLTPVLKSLEAKGYIVRARSKDDERNLLISSTDAGFELREKVLDVPQRVTCGMALEPDDAKALYRILYLLLDKQ